MKERIAWGRLAYGAVALLAGGFGAYWGQPLIHDNTDAVNLIVTVYSILAGLLIAVITVLGSTESIVHGSWRAAHYSSQVIQRRLFRHRLLFKIYLITLMLIFISMLLKDKYPDVKVWLEHGFLFFSIVAFIMSLTMPSALMKVQQEMLDNEIDRRKKEAGIESD